MNRAFIILLLLIALSVQSAVASQLLSNSQVVDSDEMRKEKYVQACATWRFLIDMRFKTIAVFFSLSSGLFIVFGWFQKKGQGAAVAIIAILLTISAIGMDWRCRMLYRKANVYAQELESSGNVTNHGICHALGLGWYHDLDMKQELKQNLKSSFNIIYLAMLVGWCICFRTAISKRGKHQQE